MVSLLPREKNALSISFLSMLLRSVIHLETTVACRQDLEKRMGLQLGQAKLDDILIPSFRFDDDTLFDVDTVQRILVNYGEFEGTREDTEKVGKLMENYLAEIATDCNLSSLKFINLAEHVPDQERAHPVIDDKERKKLCCLINCQKLTPEACAHATRNDRLSAEMMVQVLYYEQQRLREIVGGASRLNPLPDDPYQAYKTKTIS
ncbi:BTB/POZ domain-containing protein SR1IP1-like protein [Tanacetum coccineum]